MGFTANALCRTPWNLPPPPLFRNYLSPATPRIKNRQLSKNLCGQRGSKWVCNPNEDCREFKNKMTAGMRKQKKDLRALLDQGMLPLFYWDDAGVSLEIMRVLYKAGIRAVEYTNRGVGALGNFKSLKKVLA